MNRKSLRWLLALAPLLLLGCATSATHEPRNLDAHKRELRSYVSSGDYAADLAAVAAQARAWIETRAARLAPGQSRCISWPGRSEPPDSSTVATQACPNLPDLISSASQASPAPKSF